MVDSRYWPAAILAALVLLSLPRGAWAADSEPGFDSPTAGSASTERSPGLIGAIDEGPDEHGHAAADHAMEHADPHGEHGGHGADATHGAMGASLPLLSVAPFAMLLLSIAVLPLLAEHWWHQNRNKGIVAAALATPLALYLVIAWGDAGWHELVEKVEEYISFIVLLAALYVISGGVYIKGSLSGTPLVNTGVMTLGTLLASFIGTTGASVLLIRPLLRANKSRHAKAHIVVFFIFTVSNCGGLLTPLGDPPLFLGFLKGVPFEWTLVNLWPQWLTVNLVLLGLFHLWDGFVFNREERQRTGSQLEEVMQHEPLAIQGGFNFLLLAGVVVTIWAAGNFGFPFGVQEAIMAALALAAYFFTPAAYRQANHFTFGPIVEVAVLFIGIFITMAPALQILNAWGSGQREIFGLPFALSQAWHFFWATGLLSSGLDNAPTYLTLAATAAGQSGVAAEGPYLKVLLEQGPAAQRLVGAISCGAVFMGANTYIGNGPNFMVKAIAEESGVRMPSFFGYMLFSGAVLIPIFVGMTLVFFRG